MEIGGLLMRRHDRGNCNVERDANYVDIDVGIFVDHSSRSGRYSMKRARGGGSLVKLFLPEDWQVRVFE